MLSAYRKSIIKQGAMVDYGVLIDSGDFNGLSSREAIKKITDWLAKNKAGRKTIQYKLRDWIFSRQHYWGEPIPIIHCQKCGAVAVPDKDLPVELPHVEKYRMLIEGFELNGIPVSPSVGGAVLRADAMRRCKPC